MEHLLQTDCLRAELDLVLLLVAHAAVLVFDRVQPYRKIGGRNAAAVFVAHRFDAVAFSGNGKPVGEDGVLVQLDRAAPPFDALGMNPLMLGAPLGGVGALGPEPFVQKQPRPARTVA